MSKLGFAKTLLVGSALVLGAATMAACSGGGGGGGGSTAPVAGPPPPPAPNTYTPGVFTSKSTFEAQCENPRSGVDIEGNAFPDVQGTLSDELFWLRSWTDETYLWNDMVQDQDPNSFPDRLSYFAELKTFETTPSGEDLDDFHFSQPTDEFLEQRNSAPTASYGVSYVAFSSSPPRDFRIRYTDPDTPASDIVAGEVNFPRGAQILEVDGIDLVNGADVDGLNAGLFPETAGETHSFLIQEAGSSDTRTVTLVSENLAAKPVNRTGVISTASGDVGYILFNTFSPFASEEEIAEAMQEMSDAGVNDLVLDLRYNGGGLLAVAAQLSYMIAGDAQTNNRTFELLEFNDDAPTGTNPVTGERNDPIPFFATGQGFSLASGTPLPSLDLNRIFILSTARTCSASEAVINGLRGIDIEIILIGAVTCGKPYGFFPTDNCGETYYTIQFRGLNDKGFGDYSDGFVPDNSSFGFGERVDGCVVADDFNNELGDTSEALLAAALQYREDGTCPTPPAGASSKSSLQSEAAPAFGKSLERGEIRVPESVFDSNRDMTGAR